MCDQQRLRPACAYAQSGQSLSKSLEYSMTVKLPTEHHLEFLSLEGGCIGSSESRLVKIPHCRSKGAKIRNRYNQVPHLIQDTNGKVTNSQLDTTNESQEVSSFPAGDHKAHINRRLKGIANTRHIYNI